MRKYGIAIVMAGLLAIGTTSAVGAIMSTGFHKSTVSGYQTDGANLLQDIVDSGFDFDGTVNSPNEIAVEDFLADNALFSAVMVERGTDASLYLDDLVVGFFSDDTNTVFNSNIQSYSGVNYDGQLIRGWIGGNEVLPGTASSTDVDQILLYGLGVSFDDTQANRDYFVSEIEFDVDVQYGLIRGLIQTHSATTTVTSAPEPSALGMIMVGLVAVARRRKR